MKLEFVTKVIVACIFASTSLSSTWAQSRRPEKSPPKIRQIKYPATLKGKTQRSLQDSVQIMRVDRPAWGSARRNTKVFFDDQIKLESEITVKLKITQPDRASMFVTLPKPKKHPDLNIDFNEAQYRILEEPPDIVKFEIIKGVAISEVSGSGNFLTVLASNVISQVRGGSTTRALFVVYPDSSADSSFVFLDKGKPGSVTFSSAGNAIGEMEEGKIARMSGGKINISIPDSATTVALRNFIKFYTITIWPRPFWRKPAFLGAVTAAAIGGGYFILKPPGEKDLPGPPGLPSKR